MGFEDHWGQCFASFLFLFEFIEAYLSQLSLSTWSSGISLKAWPLSVFGSTACVFEVFPQHMCIGYWFSHWQVVMEFTMPWVQTVHQSSTKMICTDSQVQR